MPQFDPSVIAPQIVWLVLVFAAFYALVSTTLPKVEAVVADRRARIAADLKAAERARAEAEAASAGGKAGLGDARDAAARRVAEARAAADARIAELVRAAQARIADQSARAEAALAAARAEALAELDKVAADVAAELVRKVAGLDVAENEAAGVVRRLAA
ncbi:F0F1 ATP synthase subunit B family protein [Thermaurantiacus sp.]